MYVTLLLDLIIILFVSRLYVNLIASVIFCRVSIANIFIHAQKSNISRIARGKHSSVEDRRYPHFYIPFRCVGRWDPHKLREIIAYIPPSPPFSLVSRLSNFVTIRRAREIDKNGEPTRFSVLSSLLASILSSDPSPLSSPHLFPRDRCNFLRRIPALSSFFEPTFVLRFNSYSPCIIESRCTWCVLFRGVGEGGDMSVIVYKSRIRRTKKCDRPPSMCLRVCL